MEEPCTDDPPPDAFAEDHPSDHPTGDLPTSFEFVGEGAANVVFAAKEGHRLWDEGMPDVLYHPSQGQNPAWLTSSSGWLLRLPKKKQQGETFSCGEQEQYWKDDIKPPFGPKDLVKHQVVRAHSRWNIEANANNALVNLDRTGHFDQAGKIRVDFRGSRIADTDLVILVEDMRKRKLVLGRQLFFTGDSQIMLLQCGLLTWSSS
jgi:hypothetical protein